jgi:hypothetical protein
MEALHAFTNKLGTYDFPILLFLFKASIVVFIVLSIVLFIYDKFIQRENQLLINYPLIGRLRYFFYLLRDPMRQYFGDEKFYESMDKLDWVYNASRDKINFASFSPAQPLPKPKFMLRHTNIVLNDDEVDNEFSVTFGENREKPFVANSVIARAPMSDGSISPEGTRAFVYGAKMGRFPINSGEGGLTSNFFVTHYSPYTRKVLVFMSVPVLLASHIKDKKLL